MYKIDDFLDWFREYFSHTPPPLPAEIEGIFIYGSYVRGEQTPLSDLDVAYVMNDQDNISPDTLLYLNRLADSFAQKFSVRFSAKHVDVNGRGESQIEPIFSHLIFHETADIWGETANHYLKLRVQDFALENMTPAMDSLIKKFRSKLLDTLLNSCPSQPISKISGMYPGEIQPHDWQRATAYQISDRILQIALFSYLREFPTQQTFSSYVGANYYIANVMPETQELLRLAINVRKHVGSNSSENAALIERANYMAMSLGQGFTTPDRKVDFAYHNG